MQSSDYQNEVQSTLQTKGTVNLLTLAHYHHVNQNVSCHLFVLDYGYSKAKDVILACFDKLFKVATIQREEIIHSDYLTSDFKNKYMVNVRNIKFPLNRIFLLLAIINVLLRWNLWGGKNYCLSGSFDQNENCICSKCLRFCRSLQSKFTLYYCSPYG